jgi:Mg-chelatase subunit ChlD
LSFNDWQFSEREVDDLVIAIVKRIRAHPEIVLGPSVRGTLAFKGVLLAFQEMRKELPANKIMMAAVITLFHRVTTREDNGEMAAAIVRNCVNEVLENAGFSGDKAEDSEDGCLPRASEGVVTLNDSSALFQSAEGESPVEDQTTLLKEHNGQERFAGTSSGKGKSRLSVLESWSSTKDEASGRLQSSERRNGLSETVLEMLDLQDRQWQREIELDQLLKYYHMQLTTEGKKLDPRKTDYAGLRVLVDELAKQEVLAAVPAGTGYRVTAKALEKWLEHIGSKGSWGKSLERLIPEDRRACGERRHEIRPYHVGDVFRHISIRHSVKELAKQKKQLSKISRSDLRVFTKLKHAVKKDIVVCIDTSSSMGHQQKLVYARLIAAAIAKAALDNGDRIGVVVFDNLGQIIHSLTREKREFLNHILKVTPRGNTNIGDGIKQSRQLLLRESRANEKFIILITDGEATAVSEKGLDNLARVEGKNLTEEYALLETKKAAVRGIRISAIRVGGDSKRYDDFVRKLARIGQGKYKTVRSLQEIRAMMWGT